MDILEKNPAETVELSQNLLALTAQSKLYERQRCFIGHSHEASWRNDILNACADVLPQFSLEPWYAADHFDPTRPLRNKIVEVIANSRFGIYDLSCVVGDDKEWKPPYNVLIELGIAIALNRPTLLLRHANNRSLPLPRCLQGVELIEFAGDTTLKKALNERLKQWVDADPENAWLNRFCIFGSRVCSFREEHPRARQWGQRTMCCHVSDGLDNSHPGFQSIEREEIRTAFEEIFSRFGGLTFSYFDELSLAEGYQFILCSLCQTVRSTPFAIYYLKPYTPSEVFIAIGISIAIETLFEYDIPKVILVNDESDLPSLLRGYEVVEAVNASEAKRKLKTIIPTVIQKAKASTWKPRPLPFISAEITHITQAETEETSAEQARQLVLQGTEKMNHREFEPAIEMFQRATELDPHNFEPFRLLGASLLELNRFQEAEQSLQEAIRLSPDNASAHYSLALALQKQKSHNRALESFRKVIELDPSDVSAWTQYAGIIKSLKRFDEAERVYNEMLEKFPDDQAARSGLREIREARSLWSGGGKVRIYDLAKELKLESKKILEDARRMGVDVSVPSNTLGSPIANKIREMYRPKKKEIVTPQQTARLIKTPSASSASHVQQPVNDITQVAEGGKTRIIKLNPPHPSKPPAGTSTGEVTNLSSYTDGSKAGEITQLELADNSIVCVECGAKFTLTPDEQIVYAKMPSPKRCKPCRDLRKAKRKKSL